MAFDKSKFLTNPHLDSEGFPLAQANPKGWQEVDGVALPSVDSWAQRDRTALDTATQLWRTDVTQTSLAA